MATERYVNVVIEITIPTDLPVDCADAEKSEAVTDYMLGLMDDRPMLRNAVASGRWETADA